jgi:hypothetical protein
MQINKEMLKKHKKTVRIHRKAVRKACFKMGIPLQGLLHDLSKYSKEELFIANWYVGTKSPHDIARAELGYSPSWIYHKSKNKHHWEYWTDFNSAKLVEGEYIIKATAVKMPYKYVIEMFCDFIGAGKAYLKDKWNTESPLAYWKANCEGDRLMHSASENLLKYLLTVMTDFINENGFYKWYKENRIALIKMYEEDAFND